jgi:outer membrane protein insertion porin family
MIEINRSGARRESMVYHAGIFAGWRRAVSAFFVAISFSLLALPVQAQNLRFTQYDIQGNQRIESATIANFAGITLGETVSGGQVNEAVQRLQASGLFETVEVVPRGSTLVIIVQEFPTVNVVAIEGNDRIDDEDLLPILTTQVRRVYSPSTAEQDAANITDAYRLSGRLAATVTPVIIRRSDNRVDVVFEVTEGSVVETERLAFVGNRAFSDRRLRRVVDSTQAGIFRILVGSDTFIEDRIAFDQQLLTDFYRDRGYVDFNVQAVTSELSRERDGFFITFNIREGQSFSIGEITTASDLPEVDADEFQDTIRLRTGNTFSPRLIDLAISRMENLATEQGLRFIRVEPRITRNDETLTLDVEFNVTRGPRVFVERIDIEGNATTLDRVIRRQFDTVEGDPFDPRAIRQASERIEALGFFSATQVEAREGTSPDRVIVDVDVEEQPTGSLGFSVGYSSDDGTGLAVNFSENNFLGRGQALRFGFDTTGDSQSVSASFVEPAFMARDLALSVSVFTSSSDDDGATYDTESTGFRTGLGFPVSENGRLSLFYSLSQDTLSDIDTSSSPILRADAGTQTTSSIGYSYTFDNRRTGLNPDAGFLVRFGQEFAGVGGDSEYVRTTGLVQAETNIFREEVGLSAAFEGGALTMLGGSNSRLTDRFFLSSRQLRGFEGLGVGPREVGTTVNNDALGGNFYAVARFEADFPLGLPEEYGISGGVFYDIGSVWGLDDTAGAAPVDDSLNWRQSVGFSIFWDTQIGPLRLNFSRVLQSEETDKERDFELTVQARF